MKIINTKVVKVRRHRFTLLGVTCFCGGFTTFSTFSMEIIHFFRQGDFMHGVFHLTASLIACLTFTMLGYWITTH